MSILATFMYKGMAVFVLDTGFMWFAYVRGGEVKFGCARSLHDIDLYA